VPPENRPSVTSAASSPAPPPFIAPVMASISPHSGTALRALITDDDDVARFDLPARISSIAASSPSKTRAVPSKQSWSIPAIFTTLPLGASEPRRMAMPPCA